MAIDASIYSAFAPKVNSIADYLSQFQQHDLDQQQIAQNKLALASGQQKLDAYSQQQGETNQLRAALSGGLDLATPEGRSRAVQLAPTVAPGLIDTWQKGATAQALAAKDTAEAGKMKEDTAGSAFQHFQQRLGTVQSPAEAAALITAAHDDSTIGPMLDQYGSIQDRIGRMQQAAAQGPQGFAQWRAMAAMGVAKLADLAKVNNVDTGGATQTQLVQPATGQVQTVATLQNTVSPNTAANNATSRANNAANIGKDFAIAGLGPDGKDTGGGTGGLSPAAIEAGAARYLVDGTLPTNVGRGAQGARDIRKMLNRAGELAVGIDPTQQRINQLDAKSAGAALTQLTKAKTMSGAFEDTANQNAELALSLSKKNDRTGIPLLNAGLQAWRSGTGSPEATQFAAANETFVNEYAKIMSGGMGNGPVSDSMRNKAHDLLTTAMTGGDKGQYESNVRLLQQEMRNRMKGFDDQEVALKSRIKGGGSAAPQASPASAGGPTVSNW